MATEFKNVFIKIPSFYPGKVNEEKEFFGEVEFANPVVNAETALNGFNLNFGKKNKCIHCIQLDSDVEKIKGNIVQVKINLIFNNDSLKDTLEGWVSVLVIAATEDKAINLI